MKHQAKDSNPVICIPDIAVRELDQVEKMKPEFSMDDLVSWVNSAVSRFYPKANEGGDKRVSTSFTVRTLRYYQTLGCLDAPEKDGRLAIYGFRHYLQALLIRKLLYIRSSSESIHATLKGKTDKQYKEMLFADLQITPSKALPVTSAEYSNSTAKYSPAPEIWTRISLGAGMELNLKDQAVGLSESSKIKIIKLIYQEIKKS
jgi:DNA-binding transcriptional MerR regulator